MAFEKSVDKLWDRLNEDIANDRLNDKHYLYPQVNDIMDGYFLRNLKRLIEKVKSD